MLDLLQIVHEVEKNRKFDLFHNQSATIGSVYELSLERCQPHIPVPKIEVAAEQLMLDPDNYEKISYSSQPLTNHDKIVAVAVETRLVRDNNRIVVEVKKWLLENKHIQNDQPHSIWFANETPGAQPSFYEPIHSIIYTFGDFTFKDNRNRRIVFEGGFLKETC